MKLARRYLEVSAFVIIWMALGWIFSLNANAYLLIGVPLVALFQLAVRRQPLRKLWVRESTRFTIGRWSWLIAFALAIDPVLKLTRLVPKGLWTSSGWTLCCVAGAIAAAFALSHQNATRLARSIPSFVAAVALGTAVMAASAVSHGGSPLFHWTEIGYFCDQFVLYFAVGFILEEVAFRGAIDAHLCPPENNPQSAIFAWTSAIFGSALWSMWHLPLFGTNDPSELLAQTPMLLLIHLAIGVPLCFCWRTSGTLLLPALAYALIDAYRNVLTF